VFGSAKSGISACKTLIQGVANVSSQLPLVRGTVPATDSGFEVGGATGNIANHVQVDGFDIRNTQVALYSDPGTTGTVFSNSVITVPTNGYGVILDTSTSASALNNRTDGQNLGTFFGVWDYNGTNNIVDGNKCRRHKGSAGIFASGSSGLVIQRNIVEGSYMGVWMSHPNGGFTLYNNTVDSNDYLAVYAEGPTAAVTSRNNILTNNGVGWAADSPASAALVSSDYEDVWNNKANYVFHGTVATGAHSISASPNFVQTADPTLATYYKLNPGSPCIATGVNVGLPFGPPAPDMGAVVSH
jgi:parallel beta-helix repeat protein